MAERWRQLGLLVATGVGAWLAVELTRTPDVPVPASPATAGAVAELPRVEVDAPDLATLRETLERPLFDDDRRPDPVTGDAPAVPEAGPPPKPVPVRLSAVIVGSDGVRSVLVQPEGQDRPQRVRKGEQVAGWRVDEISDDSVVVSSGSQTSVVPLRQFEPPPARRPPVRPAAPRRPPLPQPAAKPADAGEAPPPAAAPPPPAVPAAKPPAVARPPAKPLARPR